MQVKFELTVGQQRIQGTTTVTPGMSLSRSSRSYVIDFGITLGANSQCHIDHSNGIPRWRW